MSEGRTRTLQRSGAVVNVLVLSVLLAACSTPTTQDDQATVLDIPRTPEGHPDLNGVWQAFTTASWNILDHNAQKGVPAGQGIVEGNDIPYQPWAAAQQQENYELRSELDPLHNCYLPGVPRIMYMPYPFRINQVSELIAITFEYSHAYRWVWTNGTDHPEALEFWMADSRGHWEGDTLVVSVADFNNQTWFDRAGNFHSEEMRLVERYTPMGPNHISYEVTVEDPKVFTRPWSMQTVLYRRLEENVQTLDYECLEFEEPFLPWDEVPVPGMPGPPNR
jgi:hypothetical protein